jgi:hypothetical protein
LGPVGANFEVSGAIFVPLPGMNFGSGGFAWGSQTLVGVAAVLCGVPPGADGAASTGCALNSRPHVTATANTGPDLRRGNHSQRDLICYLPTSPIGIRRSAAHCPHTTEPEASVKTRNGVSNRGCCSRLRDQNSLPLPVE